MVNLSAPDSLNFPLIFFFWCTSWYLF